MCITFGNDCILFVRGLLGNLDSAALRHDVELNLEGRSVDFKQPGDLSAPALWSKHDRQEWLKMFPAILLGGVVGWEPSLVHV